MVLLNNLVILFKLNNDFTPCLILYQVPMKFRYPFFMELHWYVLERYLYVLSGRKYSIKLNEEAKDGECLI